MEPTTAEAESSFENNALGGKRGDVYRVGKGKKAFSREAAGGWKDGNVLFERSLVPIIGRGRGQDTTGISDSAWPSLRMRRRLELAPLLDGSRPVLLVASSMWQLMPWQIAALGSGYLGTPCAFTRSLSLAFPTELDARSKRSGASPARVKAHLYSPSAPNLLLTSEEVAAVAALLADRGFEVPTFNDSSASVGSLTGSSLRDDLLVLHFAGHSEFDAIDSGLSRLLLSKPGRIAASSWLTAAEIEAAQTSHGPQLVYLSSCKSALTENRPGDEPIGLVKAFFSLGAEALICTTWETLDSSAKDMSTRFYTALLEGNTVAEESGRVASCQE